jgi:hypothetical protein
MPGGTLPTRWTDELVGRRTRGNDEIEARQSHSATQDDAEKDPAALAEWTDETKTTTADSLIEMALLMELVGEFPTVAAKLRGLGLPLFRKASSAGRLPIIMKSAYRTQPSPPLDSTR